MQFPWVQVTNEIIDVAAAEIAAELGEDELRMLGAVNKLYRWAIQRCREDRPPSVQDVVPGAGAAKLIFAKAGLIGIDEAAFLVAFSNADVLEQRPDGVRIRGMKRYDAGWRKNYPEKARAWDAAHPPAPPPEPAPKPGRHRPEAGTTSGRQTQTQTQTQKKDADPDSQPQPQQQPPRPTDTPDGLHGAPRPPAARWVADPRDPGSTWMVAERSREGVWALIQLVRRERGLHPEGDWPDKFGAWCDRALRENGRWGIHVALNRYFSDEDFRKKSWATRVFITEGVYGARAPPRDEEQEAFYDEPSREAA